MLLCKILAILLQKPCKFFQKVTAMTPRKPPIEDAQLDLFRPELIQFINPRHELVKLADEIDWERFEDLFGATYCPDNGRPGVSTRLMVALQYLKYTYSYSDEGVVDAWFENPYFQYLSGMKWFEHTRPIDPSSISRWRKRIVESGAERLLAETIRCGLKLKFVKSSQLSWINVDTTVQEKNIRYPTDGRLYDRAREKLVKAAQDRGIHLRQNYNRKSKQAHCRQSRYAHARQMN
jgi:IS5 family transposase